MKTLKGLNREIDRLITACRDYSACSEHEFKEKQDEIFECMKDILEYNMKLYEDCSDKQKKFNVLRKMLNVFVVSEFEDKYGFSAVLYNVMMEEKYASFKNFYGEDAQTYIVKYFSKHELDAKDNERFCYWDGNGNFEQEFVKKLQEESEKKGSPQKESTKRASAFGIAGICSLALSILLLAVGVGFFVSYKSNRDAQVQTLLTKNKVLETELTSKTQELSKLKEAQKEDTYILEQKKNLRMEANTDSEVIQELEEGTEVIIGENTKEDWYEVDVIIKGFINLKDFCNNDND